MVWKWILTLIGTRASNNFNYIATELLQLLGYCLHKYLDIKILKNIQVYVSLLLCLRVYFKYYFIWICFNGFSNNLAKNIANLKYMKDLNLLQIFLLYFVKNNNINERINI